MRTNIRHTMTFANARYVAELETYQFGHFWDVRGPDIDTMIPTSDTSRASAEQAIRTAIWRAVKHLVA